MQQLVITTECSFLQLEPCLRRVLPSAVVRGQKNPLHLRFAQRLKKARRAKRLTRSALSLAAGLTRSALHGLEHEDRIPRLDTVERLAAVLGISPCALAFGMEQTEEPGTGVGSGGVPVRLYEARHARGLSMRELGRLSDTSDTLVRMTETGQTAPNLAKLESLAKALDVSACWLGFGVGPMERPARRAARRDASVQP